MPTRFGLPHHGSLYIQQAVKCVQSSQKGKWYIPTGFPQMISSGGPGTVSNAMNVPISAAYLTLIFKTSIWRNYIKTLTMEALPGNCTTLNFGAK